MSEAAIKLHVEPLEEGGYVATSPDVPGLVAQGRTITEAVEIAQGLARKIVESCIEHGDPIPPALAGFKYVEVARKLRAFGYIFDRPGPGSHEVWRQPNTGKKVTLPHHPGDMPEGTLRAILREADIGPEDFLGT